MNTLENRTNVPSIELKQRIDKIQKELENPNYDWRLLKSLAQSTALSEQQILESFGYMPDVIRLELEGGQFTYTSREAHWKKSSPFKKMLMILAN